MTEATRVLNTLRNDSSLSRRDVIAGHGRSAEQQGAGFGLRAFCYGKGGGGAGGVTVMPAACSPVFKAVFTEAASNPSSRRLDGKASVPVTRIACLRCTQRFSTMRSTCSSVIGSPSLAHPMLTLRISDRHVRVIASIRRSGPLVCPMLAAPANHFQLP